MPNNETTTALTSFGATMALVAESGENYTISSPLTGNTVELVRDVDFAKIPKTKQPTLTKSGSEKIAMAYGLMQRYAVESAIEQFDSKNEICFYRVRCDLVKGFFTPNGDYREVVYSCGYGSGNTREKRNGFNSCADAANSTLKMAQKRALSSAALAISGLSSMFTQDMENEDFMAKATDIIKETPDTPISTGKITRIFALFSSVGYTQAQAKLKMAEWGYASTKKIANKDYDSVCEKIKELKETKDNG